MDRKKALHALRSLEMTFKQKQEFIDALTEGDSTGGENIIIDIYDLWQNKEQNVSDKEIEAILNFKAILRRQYNYYSITAINQESDDSNQAIIITGVSINSDYYMVIEKDTSKLRLISNNSI